jgi:hypothetical protein
MKKNAKEEMMQMNNKFKKILGFPVTEPKPEPKPEKTKPKRKRGKDAK